MQLLHAAPWVGRLALYAGLFLCVMFSGCQGKDPSKIEAGSVTNSAHSVEEAGQADSSSAPVKEKDEVASDSGASTPEPKESLVATDATEPTTEPKSGEASAPPVMNKTDGDSNSTPSTEMAASGESSATPNDPTAPLTPRKIQILVPNREFTREGKNQAIRITFDDLDLLRVCNMEPVPPDVMNYLPEWLKSLHGQRVILRGWMFPSGRQDGITSFMFVRDNGICCFGRDPKVYDKLGVTMQRGKTTKYIEGRPFDVEATLFIEPDIEGDDEGFWWLYRMEDAVVIDR
jgi:hypothetical protein